MKRLMAFLIVGLLVGWIPPASGDHGGPSFAEGCPSGSNPDSDGDGVIDGDEDSFYFTEPCHPDTDGDLLPDGYELAMGLQPTRPEDGALDLDSDGLTNTDEYCYPMSHDVCEQRTLHTFDFRRAVTATQYDGVYWDGTDLFDSDTDNDALCDGGGTPTCAAVSISGLRTMGERLPIASVSDSHGTDARDPDSENDHLPDGYEAHYGLKLLLDDAGEDPDGDTYVRPRRIDVVQPWTNLQEYCWHPSPRRTDGVCEESSETYVLAKGPYMLGTNPVDPNTDDDCPGVGVNGATDGIDVYWGYDPNVPEPATDDRDRDGLGWCDELTLETDLLDADTDDDRLCDGGRAASCQIDGLGEVNDYLTDPHAPDTDQDGIGDGNEAAWWIQWGSHGVQDLDGDGANGLHDLDGESDVVQDGVEFAYQTDPTQADTEPDGLSDYEEIYNVLGLYTDATARDTDGDRLCDGGGGASGCLPDGKGEHWDYGTDPMLLDTEGDWLGDGDEILVHQTNPLFWDSDNDGMPDGWEVQNLLDPAFADGSKDPDNDDLKNRKEYQYGRKEYNQDHDPNWDEAEDGPWTDGTDPHDPDTDSGGFLDGYEVKHDLDPTWSGDDVLLDDQDDVDGGTETQDGTNPFLKDSDGDGLSDGQEKEIGSVPTNADSDNDRLSDYLEVYRYELNPLLADSDGNGVQDSEEVARGAQNHSRSSPTSPDDGTGLGAGTSSPNSVGAMTSPPSDPLMHETPVDLEHLHDAPSGSAPASGPAATGAAPPVAKVVLLVHGRIVDRVYDWEPLRDYLAENLDTTVRRIGWYGGECGLDADVNGNPWSATHHGDHSSHFGSWFNHHYSRVGCDGSQEMHGVDTDVRHLGYHMAWYLYDHYTKRGVPVDIVAHSLGGLIVRYAIAQTAAHHELFPPKLLVSRVVTFGSPHRAVFEPQGPGDGAGTICAPSLFAMWHWSDAFDVFQVCNGQPHAGDGSAYRSGPPEGIMYWLKYYGQEPQGADGTEWTLIGTECDDYSTPPLPSMEHLMLGMRASHYVLYKEDDAANTCYGHGDYQLDTGTARDANIAYGNDADALSFEANGPRFPQQVLESLGWKPAPPDPRNFLP